MHIVVFITAPSREEADKVSRELLNKKLAACVNIVAGMDSLFWWKAKIDRAREVLLIVKSKKSKLGKIIKTVKSNHSYDVPEIIALPVIGGYKPYLDWVNESVR